MSNPGDESPEHPTPKPGSYGEITPGVPRYGQYAPAGWEPPQDVKDAQAASRTPSSLPAARTYPGFGGQLPGTPAAAEPHLAPPRQVLLAARLIMLAGVIQSLSVVGLLLVLFVPSVKAAVVEVLQSSLADTPALADVYSDPGLVNTAMFLAFLISVAMAVTYFWLAKSVRRGAGWARITSLVLGIISIAFLGQLNPLIIAQVALGLVAVFLLFRSPAKEFFEAHKKHRSNLKR